MNRVTIEKDGVQGQIRWTDSLDSWEVEFPDDKVRALILEYLNTEREYWIPESQKIDDYRVDRAKPVDGTSYFELALNTLHARTGVYVIWK